jgi:putative methionine-R-sulfoxide reductase with GAF domain
MKLINRYYLYIALALIAIAIVFWSFNTQILSLVSLGLVIGLSIVKHIGLSMRLKQIKLQIKSTGKSDFEIITIAGKAIEEASSNIQNLIGSIRQIQRGQTIQTETLQLNAEAKSAITDLQDNLRFIREQEQQQNWVVNGIAKLGEIRKSNSALHDYAFQIISTLVKYLGANQGAFYLLAEQDNEEKKLEMLATYAYGKRKFADGKVLIEVGNGLVGQSVVERELILMTEVPKGYIKITSGLGEATPRCIVIVPLIFRDVVYGVIEMASFEKFEKHHIELINKVSESIAAELADVLRQETTARLLSQSQQQGQELKAQEEELRQNMEEMAATQEEMKRKEIQLRQV